VNLAAAPLVEKVLGESIIPCAGYGAFIASDELRLQFGLRWRPAKWAKWIHARQLDPRNKMV
jgi:hypothetical protein